MQKKILLFAFTLMAGSYQLTKAQDITQDSTYKKWFIGSTLLLLGNCVPDDPNPPKFIQVNVGYRITPKDVVSFEFKKSIYAWPLGIPWGPSFDAPGLNYPGHVRILAPTLAYQRYWWKGVYTAVHALNAFEKYMDESNKKIGNGYTLYLTFRLGYHLKFFKNRIFFEPSVGLTYWPVRTNVPESFKAVENKWPNYFPFEPGLHFGYKF
ncbi:hypothetical protein [Spirosoma panaciterrae]|uniref:hypothetical protein n=1 Tax=Spirosoma panaciterrae TaxID=496058 RepID=UPI000365BBE9|nr:hypothetical protein [Spirosoma panaciterrae]